MTFQELLISFSRKHLKYSREGTTNMATKIAIHGFYGYGNLGDEAILAVLNMEFGKSTDVHITVFSDEQNSVKKFHNVDVCPATGKKSLGTRLWRIYRSDVFILGGGGLLKDYGQDSRNIERWMRLLAWAVKMRKKTVLCCIGVENIKHERSRNLIRKIGNAVSIVTVRDNHSKKILKKCGVGRKITVVSDPVIILGGRDDRRTINPERSPSILVCPRHWFDMGFKVKDKVLNDELISALAYVCDEAQEKYGANITMVPLRAVSYDDDRKLIEMIFAKMKNNKKVNVCDNVPTVEEFTRIIKEQDLVIGMRLHSLIFAAANNVPMIGLEYMPKIKGFMESIEQEEYSLNIKTLSSELLFERARKSIEKKDERSKGMVCRVEELRDITRITLNNIVKFSRGEIDAEEV